MLGGSLIEISEDSRTVLYVLLILRFFRALVSLLVVSYATPRILVHVHAPFFLNAENIQSLVLFFMHSQCDSCVLRVAFLVDCYRLAQHPQCTYLSPRFAVYPLVLRLKFIFVFLWNFRSDKLVELLSNVMISDKLRGSFGVIGNGCRSILALLDRT